jgi:hypothetical protein
MKRYTTDEALAELVLAKAEGREIRFADDNPHWWIGVNYEGQFYWEYFCCDFCEEQEYETYQTIEELKVTTDITSKDSDWINTTHSASGAGDNGEAP